MVALPHAHVDLGAYALVGMGAFFAGFLRCPVSAVLIVFEVTGDYGLILPLMLAVAASTSLSRALAPHSLTELQMVEEGYEERASGDDPLAGLVVADVMTRDVIALPADLQLADAARLVADSRHRLFPVLDAGRRVVGLLPRSAIDDGSSSPVSVFMQTPLALARDDETVIDAIRRMGSCGIDRCAVVSADGRLAGFLSPSDILRARFRRTAGVGISSLAYTPTHAAQIDNPLRAHDRSLHHCCRRCDALSSGAGVDPRVRQGIRGGRRRDSR